MTAPLILDASGLFATPAEPWRAALTRALLDVATPVRLETGAARSLDPADLPASDAAPGEALAAVADRLAGRPAPTPPRARWAWPSLRRRPAKRASRATVPAGARVLTVGLSAWADPALPAWLAGRPDLQAIALVEDPTALHAPEYVTADAEAAVPAALAALREHARAVVVPTQTARARLAAAIGRPDLPLHVVAWPSPLAGTAAGLPSPALPPTPFLLVPLPIEAGRNTTLLLLALRDLVHRGVAVPKLVLAGERGTQTEFIRPLLDWADALMPHVIEAPRLPPAALRHLAEHAAAVLLPGFAEESGALLRDLAALGLPVVASDIPIHREALGGRGRLIDPIDGLGWKRALVEHAPAEAPATGPLRTAADLRRALDALVLPPAPQRRS